MSAAATGSAAATRSAPPLGAAPAPAVLSAAESGLPLASYEPSARQQEVIVQAVGITQARCMARRGYRGFTPTPTMPSPATLPGGGGPFGYINPGYAARRGFHPPAPGSGARGQGMTLDEARAALACDVAAEQTLSPLAGKDAVLIGALDRAATEDAAADPRVRAATDRWAACMSKAGFGAVDPAALARGPWPGEPSGREIATAKADAACTGSANLAGIYFAALAGYQRELIAQHRGALAGLAREGQSAVARAARVVSGNR